MGLRYALCGHMLGVQTSDHGRRLRDAIALCLTTSVPATAAEHDAPGGFRQLAPAFAQLVRIVEFTCAAESGLGGGDPTPEGWRRASAHPA